MRCKHTSHLFIYRNNNNENSNVMNAWYSLITVIWYVIFSSKIIKDHTFTYTHFKIMCHSEGSQCVCVCVLLAYFSHTHVSLWNVCHFRFWRSSANGFLGIGLPKRITLNSWLRRVRHRLIYIYIYTERSFNPYGHIVIT